jgi:hypothetical protein
VKELDKYWQRMEKQMTEMTYRRKFTRNCDNMRLYYSLNHPEYGRLLFPATRDEASFIDYEEWMDLHSGMMQFFRNYTDIEISYYNQADEKIKNDEHERLMSGIKPASTPEGYVYLVRIGDYYKVGATSNPKSRLTSFKAATPFEVEEIAIVQVDDYKILEQEIIKEYADCRVGSKTEWFDLDIVQVDEIMDKMEGRGVPNPATEQP